MDDVHESEQTPVYHAVDAGTSEAPRLFVLVQEDLDEDYAVIREVVAYGIALPGGAAATVFARGGGFGRWISPESASRRLHSELVWV
ncbi:hypothetical protein [Actinomadura chibensis]|uniref:Uncharacterized protein n=1 Tax=Actinomadura chibensis TaxID=392828 RepID=A0A5D0NRG8_9ACTN|nr:hypothetical protein [Actinomadura chibensis]TYB46728.1 hypothetical protein FXF69_16130 [Actinomadura chibensis]